MPQDVPVLGTHALGVWFPLPGVPCSMMQNLPLEPAQNQQLQEAFLDPMPLAPDIIGPLPELTVFSCSINLY